MNELFIPIVGFKGTIDDLQAKEEFQPTIDEMPIDMIVNMVNSKNSATNSTKNGDHDAS